MTWNNTKGEINDKEEQDRYFIINRHTLFLQGHIRTSQVGEQRMVICGRRKCRVMRISGGRYSQ